MVSYSVSNIDSKFEDNIVSDKVIVAVYSKPKMRLEGPKNSKYHTGQAEEREMYRGICKPVTLKTYNNINNHVKTSL